MGPSPPSCLELHESSGLELHESSGVPSVVLSIELASSEASAVVSPPSVGSGGVLAILTLMPFLLKSFMAYSSV